MISTGSQQVLLGNIIIPGYNFYMSPDTTTNYSVTTLTDATGCVNAFNPGFTVTVEPGPDLTVTPDVDTTICGIDSVVLSAVQSLTYTYQWFKNNIYIPGANSSKYSAKATGAFAVLIYTPNGCFDTSEAVNVTVLPGPAVSLGNDTTMAAWHTLTLNAGGGHTSYLWSTGATTQSIVADSAGIGAGTAAFSVTVTQSDGCKGADTIKITFILNPGITENA